MERFVRAVAPCALRRTVFYPCYGLAEATLMVSGSSRQHVPVVRSFDKKSLLDHKIHPVSGNSPEQSPEQSMVGCGSSLPDQEIAIVGPGSNTPAAANEIGEIWVKGEERLVVVQEATISRNHDLDNTLRLIRQNIAEVHELAPWAVVLVRSGTVPKTSSGKIQRKACKAAFLENSLHVVKEWREGEAGASALPLAPAEDRAAWLVAEVARLSGMDAATIDIHQPLTAYGFDPLSAVELSHKL